MAKTNNGVSLTIMGLFIALLGVIIPIAWDLWNSSAEVTLTINKTATIVEKKNNVEKLQILYGGRQVDSLSKTSFEIKNTGRKAVTVDDLISNPRIALKEGNILEAEIVKSSPENIDKNIVIDEKSISLEFKLLNPGDLIVFSILSDVKDPEFISSARIKNVRNLKIMKAEEQVMINGNVGFLVYLVGIFSMLFLLVFFALLWEAPKLKKQLLAIKRAETPLHKGESIEVILSYIDLDLSMLTTAKRKRLKESIPSGIDRLDEIETKKLISEVSAMLNSESPVGGAIVSLILAALGGWYVYSSVFV